MSKDKKNCIPQGKELSEWQNEIKNIFKRFEEEAKRAAKKLVKKKNKRCSL